uniref:Uncharacterized protein n=1 Tax=Rhizophora mucronata TaxID=61149 RepID=A0A2P2KYG7_RHIMU
MRFKVEQQRTKFWMENDNRVINGVHTILLKNFCNNFESTKNVLQIKQFPSEDSR